MFQPNWTRFSSVTEKFHGLAWLNKRCSSMQSAIWGRILQSSITGLPILVNGSGKDYRQGNMIAAKKNSMPRLEPMHSHTQPTNAVGETATVGNALRIRIVHLD